jgi:hypothetical protein
MTQDDDRARAVADLREAARVLLSRLEARGEALTVIASGVVVVNANHRDLRPGGIAPEEVGEHYVRQIYAPAHECVHTVQLLTTRFVLEMAIEYFNLCGIANGHRRAGRPEADWLPSVLGAYRVADQRLNGREAGDFSSLQVMEAHAVLEGFRGGMSRHLPEGLAMVRELAHGRLEDYAVIIDASLERFGFDRTLSVLPRLCWIALNHEAPGQYFTQMFSSLSEGDVRWVVGASASQTCEALGMDASRAAQSWRVRRPALRDHPLHGILGRYFDVLERQSDPEAYLQLAMHPGRGPASGARVQLKDLMPPLAVYADDVVLMNGPYRDDGWSAAEPLLRVSAQIIETIGWLDERARTT